MSRRTSGLLDYLHGRQKTIRSTVLFVCGLAGICYETVVEHTERPTLLILFAGMVGLPAFLKMDESHAGTDESPAKVTTKGSGQGES